MVTSFIRVGGHVLTDWVAGGRGDRLRRGDVVDRRDSNEFSQELGLRADLVNDDSFQIFQYEFWMLYL